MIYTTILTILKIIFLSLKKHFSKQTIFFLEWPDRYPFCFRNWTLFRTPITAMEGGGGTLSEVHQTARKLLLKTRDGLERLERLEYSNSSSSSSDLSFAVSKDITQIQSLCVEMNRLSRSISVRSQRDLWKRLTRLSPFPSLCLCFLIDQ